MDYWFLQFFGRLHPLAVHFPIGLLVVALFLECLTLGGKRQGLRDGINWMVWLGALFAVAACLLGWLLATFDDYSGDLVQTHQNLGIATAVLAAITAFILFRTTSGKIQKYTAYRSALAITVIALTITGHLGASLTHGEDFLTSVLPSGNDAYDNENTGLLLAELSQLDSLTELEQDKLNLEVRAIFAHNCYQCHSENKKKGELVLENKRGVFQGGESGPVITAGFPEKSELYRRVSLSSNHDEVMPKKGKTLKKEEIALIKLWIKNGAHWSDRALMVFPEAPLALSKPDLPNNPGQHQNPIDILIHNYFDQNNVDWQTVVDDRTFVRRAYLDIIGLLPSPKQISEFLNDQNTNKRTQLIDSLLNDNHNYTQHWLSFWNDLLRNDYSGTGFITGGRKQITDWLYDALLQNKPYNQLVAELVNPTDASEGFIKGIQWRGVVNASQRTEMQAAQNIGQSLMGVNVKCASCHNSFVSNLTLKKSYGFASIFADSTLELNRCDKPIGKMAKVNFLYTELGSVEAETVKERLRKLSEVIVKPENGRLYRTITNRMWKRLTGRGIVEPVDEMDNAPWDTALLDWLAADFIDSGYDLKYLIRLIMTSDTYQLPTMAYDRVEDIKTKKYVFKGPLVRRMSAEQFSDAVSQVVAPLYYATAYNPEESNLTSRRVWHREVKFDRDVLPDPGKRYFRYSFNLKNKEISEARAIVSVDHSYLLYVNERQVAEGSDWRKVDKPDLTNALKPGDNVLAIEGNNEGKIANPAGILFALKVRYSDGEEIILEPGTDWKSTDEQPTVGWIGQSFDDKEWKNSKSYGNKHWDNLVNYSFEENAQEFARASLVKQDPFMKALGRPSRENVATTRDEQATLLQALELTNGEYFNKVLQEGAESWLENQPESKTIVDNLYQRTLGRPPSDQERKVMVSALGEQPNQDALQDVFWATLLLPEFQFIH